MGGTGVSEVTCSMCGDAAPEERAILGDKGAICVDCVWMCVDILDERGERRPAAGDFDPEETSKVYDRSTFPPPLK